MTGMPRHATGAPQRPASGEPVEERLLTLARLLETLPDIRSAAADPDTEIESLLDELRRLTRYLQQRQESAAWDAADQLATRITLQTLATVAVHMRRSAVQAEALLGAGREEIRHAARELTRLQATLPHSAAAPARDVQAAVITTEVQDASPAPAAPRD